MEKDQVLSEDQMRWVVEQFTKPPQGRVKPIAIFIGGSRAVGTHSKTSDYDVYAVHMEDSNKCLSGRKLLETLTAENKELNISLQSTEVHKFLALGTKNNPNMLEMAYGIPQYVDKFYKDMFEQCITLIKKSHTMHLPKPFKSMYLGHKEKYIDKPEKKKKEPKRLLAMVVTLLRCGNYLTLRKDGITIDEMKRYLMPEDRRDLIDTLLKEKRQSKAKSSVKKQTLSFLETYCARLEEVAERNLPESVDVEDEIHNLLFEMRIRQMIDGPKR